MSEKINFKEDNRRPVLTDTEIEELDLESEETKELISLYEEETKKNAIPSPNRVMTEGFKKWLKGEKLYSRGKLRVAIYVDEKMKNDWQDFIKTKPDGISSLSNLIRKAVNKYIKESKNIIEELVKSKKEKTSISFYLKEPLTSIKGFSQLILEKYKDKLELDLLELIQNIFEQSVMLESRIRSMLDNDKKAISKYDILIIDDDIPTIRLLTNFFKDKGYSCYGVIKGSEGLEELSINYPKVILLDIMLPDLSGFEICKNVKSDEKYKNIPIYLLSAMGEPQILEHFEETNANGYIVKPFNLSDFDVILDILS